MKVERLIQVALTKYTNTRTNINLKWELVVKAESMHVAIVKIVQENKRLAECMSMKS